MGSELLIFILVRISFGITMRPSSSTLLTIPVDFNFLLTFLNFANVSAALRQRNSFYHNGIKKSIEEVKNSNHNQTKISSEIC